MFDDTSVGWSTGNLPPSDFRDQDVYPPFGEPGWAKQNRDFTMWIDGDAAAVAPFREAMWRKWHATGAVDWSPNTDLVCG